MSLSSFSAILVSLLFELSWTWFTISSLIVLITNSNRSADKNTHTTREMMAIKDKTRTNVWRKLFLQGCLPYHIQCQDPTAWPCWLHTELFSSTCKPWKNRKMQLKFVCVYNEAKYKIRWFKLDLHLSLGLHWFIINLVCFHVEVVFTYHICNQPKLMWHILISCLQWSIYMYLTPQKMRGILSTSKSISPIFLLKITQKWSMSPNPQKSTLALVFGMLTFIRTNNLIIKWWNFVLVELFPPNNLLWGDERTEEMNESSSWKQLFIEKLT